MAKREARILEIIAAEKRAEVNGLAGALGVSASTIRKDLDGLEARALIRREHGYAVLGSEDDIGNRLAFHYEVKRRIAKRAAELICEGETVMIESGSCCALLAEEIAAAKQNVRIVTNSAFIAAYIRRRPSARVTLLGGDYQNEAQVMVGPVARKAAEQFFVDKLFIGTDGYTPRAGFTGNDHYRAETARDMARQANRLVILTESVKFGKQGVVALVPAESVAMVITDAGIGADIEADLADRGVDVVKV